MNSVAASRRVFPAGTGASRPRRGFDFDEGREVLEGRLPAERRVFRADDLRDAVMDDRYFRTAGDVFERYRDAHLALHLGLFRLEEVAVHDLLVLLELEVRAAKRVGLLLV